jgi:hypothetical protein
MKKFVKGLIRFKTVAINISYVLFLLLSCFLSTNLSDYKIEKTFNSFFHNVEYQDTYLALSNKEGSNDNFNALYYNFFWTSLSSNSRRKVNDKTIIDELNLQKTSLYFQDYFTIEKNEYSDDRFYLHDGMFFTYFDSSLVTVNSVRFECDGFVLISDTLADLLLDKYGLANAGIESYKLLITEKQYAVLSYSFETGKTIKLCINNVIDSSKRVGNRVKKENSAFALTYYAYIKDLPISFETDFKGNGYSPKAIIDTIYKAGYTTDDFYYSLVKKSESGQYIEDKKNSTNLNLALINKTADTLINVFISLICFCWFFAIVLTYFFFINRFKNKKELLIIGLTLSGQSFLFLILQQFLNLYFAFSLLPTVFLSTWVICFFVRLFFGKKGGTINVKNSTEFFEINI